MFDQLSLHLRNAFAKFTLSKKMNTSVDFSAVAFLVILVLLILLVTLQRCLFVMHVSIIFKCTKKGIPQKVTFEFLSIDVIRKQSVLPVFTNGQKHLCENCLIT